MDPILRDEVEDNLTIDHPDVFNALFGKISELREMTAAVLQNCKVGVSALSGGRRMDRVAREV